MPALNQLHRDYGDRVAFYVVYIEEAHPIDGWQMDANLKDDVLAHQARKPRQVAALGGALPFRDQLSDLLFVMARWLARRDGGQETLWRR